MPLTISEMIDIAGLEGFKLRAGAAGLNNHIRWPYVAENRELAPWLLGGELIFVTGINLQRKNEDFLQLIIEAQAHHAAGMVILVGSEFIQQIPDAVLAFAEQQGFPLFEQPYSLPMVKVTELICNRIIQIDLSEHSLRWFLNNTIGSTRTLPTIALQRAQKLSLNIEQPLLVALILPDGAEKIDLDAWKYTLTRLLAPYHTNLPVLECQEGWYLFLSNDEGLNSEQQTQCWKNIFDALHSAGFPCTMGVSEAAAGIAQLGTAAQQAKQAALFSRNSTRQGVLHYSELGINKVFMAVENKALLADFCRQQLGTLFADHSTQAKMLKHTLATYFENLCKVRKTAQCLSIHRNTLQHRLQKIESLTNSNLNIAQQRLSMQNALMMEALILDPNQDITNKNNNGI